MNAKRVTNRGGLLAAQLALLAGLGLAGGAAAQSPAAPAPPAGGVQDRKPMPDNMAAKPAATPATPAAAASAVDPQEDAAYKAFYELKPTDLDHQIQLGEQFAQKYPNSRYNAAVYSRLTQAYFNKQQMDKMFVAADKTLALAPDDYTVLVTVGWVIPHTTSGGDPASDKKLDLAEHDCKRALELLPAIARPAGVSDEDFVKLKNQALSQGHSGLGLVYFRRNDFEKSVPELEQATKLGPNPDPTDLFVLGVDYQQLKRYAEARDAFQQCGKIQGGLQQRCQQSAAAAKKLAGTQLTPPKP